MSSSMLVFLPLPLWLRDCLVHHAGLLSISA